MENTYVKREIDKFGEFEMLQEKEVYDFFNKLGTGRYKAILLNNQTPLMKDDLAEPIMELIIGDLDENTKIELNGDVMVIHKENETIEVTGYKNMSDGEIFARRYLDECEYGDLIVKDSLDQVEFREDNFKNTKGYYGKCKDIVNIRTVPEDSEHYNMNWDCIIVGFEQDEYREEIWQRA
jgi:hypothetical protein